VDKRIETLEKALGICLEALEEITDPISKWRREAEEEGMNLNGYIAVQLSKDHNELKRIASRGRYKAEQVLAEESNERKEYRAKKKEETKGDI